MSIKTFFINSAVAEYSDQEFAWFQSLLLDEGIIADSTGVMGLQVTENDTPDLSVLISIGKALVEVDVDGRVFKVVVENTAEVQKSITANSSGANRVDAVIVRVDVDTEPNELKTNVGTIEVITGSGVSALSDGAIDTAVSGDGWYRLADVTIPNGDTAVTNSQIADVRTKIATNNAVTITNFIDSILTDDVSQATFLESQTTSTDTFNLGEANTTTNQNKIAQKFVASKTKYRGVTLNKKADTGTFTGTVTISLQADVSGSPSGSALATVTISNSAWLLLATGNFNAVFASEYTSAIVGNSYWIVAETSTSDTSNHPNFGGRSSGGTGNVKYNNTTDGWVAFASSDLYYKTLEGITNQVVKSGADGFISNDFINLSVRSGITTRTLNDASTTETIAHGLGRVPRKVSLTALFTQSATSQWVHGTYDSSGQRCNGLIDTEGNSTANNGVQFTSSTLAMKLFESDGLGDNNEGTVTVDATNIYIAWVKNGSTVNGAANILWQAE